MWCWTEEKVHSKWVNRFLNLSVLVFLVNWLIFVSSQTIYSSIEKGTPCVILQGSGRIADVIAHASGFPISRITTTLIKELTKKFFGEEYKNIKDDQIEAWKNMVSEVMMVQSMICGGTLWWFCYGSYCLALFGLKPSHYWPLWSNGSYAVEFSYWLQRYVLVQLCPSGLK